MHSYGIFFRVPLRFGNTSDFHGIRPRMNIADEQAKITTGIAMFVSNTTPARLCQSAAQEENRIPLRFFEKTKNTQWNTPKDSVTFFLDVYFCIDHQI